MAISDTRGAMNGICFARFDLVGLLNHWFCCSGCVLWSNWWPMLVGIMYILVPMPYVFFGASDGSGYALYGSSLASGWVDAGKFLTGFSAVGSIAIPAILAHAQVITIGALIMELAAAVVLGGTVIVYDYFSSREDSYY